MPTNWEYSPPGEKCNLDRKSASYRKLGMAVLTAT